MNAFITQPSPWMLEFHKQLLRGKHSLLHDNVLDQYLFRGPGDQHQESRYLLMVPFLEQYFEAEGYELVGIYDIVDGLSLANPAQMPLLNQLVAQSRGAAIGAAAAPRMGSDAETTPPASAPSAARRVPQVENPYARPQAALDAIRAVLSQDQVSAAMIIRFSDKLISAPDRQSAEEQKFLVQLKKIIHEAANLAESHPLAGRRNALVMVANHLGGIPAWLYHRDPFVALVQVPRPCFEERMSFIRRFLGNFHEGRGIAEPEVDEVAQQFSDLTDGLTAWDLNSIRLTSLAERISIRKPRELVDYYKYGQRDDPWERLDAARVTRACEQMGARVIGQTAAIEAVVSMLAEACVGVRMSQVTAKAGRPKGTFFFVGPTGVGKTELAKALSELIFGDDGAMARFDMSEYREPHAAEKLIGSPPGFVGHEEGGQLTRWVREHPYSVLLFDEIEKAHKNVMDKFLQILEDGRLTDGRGETVYFSQTVIIFTSNTGASTLNLRGGTTDALLSYEEVRKHFEEAVKNHFTQELARPELLNRLGQNILAFDLLRPEHIAGISRKFLRALVESAASKRSLRLVFPNDGVVEMMQAIMLTGDNLLFGGRRIKMLLESLVERPLNRWVFFNDPPSGAEIAITPAASGQEVEFCRVSSTP